MAPGEGSIVWAMVATVQHNKGCITAATAATLRKADELGCRSLALVAFGTGVGGFPLDDAARLMVGAVRRHRPGSLQRVVFAVHGDAAERAFSAAIQAGEDTARR